MDNECEAEIVLYLPLITILNLADFKNLKENEFADFSAIYLKFASHRLVEV